MNDGPPWTNVSFVGVYHDDPQRVGRLLDYVRPWFKRLVIGVQTNDPANDLTLRVAREFADELIVERVAGLAEPTLANLIPLVATEWSFVVSADERPDETLLRSIGEMTYIADHGDEYSELDGFWIRFLSSIDGILYESEQDNHLRLFRSKLGWPEKMHSRPHASYTTFWPKHRGYIAHDRSLDEMMRDYLRYYAMSSGEEGWVNHNRAMMHDACTATAQAKGLESIVTFDWWPQVWDVSFKACDDTSRCVAGGAYDCRQIDWTREERRFEWLKQRSG